MTTHWLPQPLNEGARTACGLDVNEHPRIAWRTSQNEADCRRCLTAALLSKRQED